MKRINYIFYTGVSIIFLLIVSPIYWQYEVNEFHKASHFYQIDNFQGKTVEESYTILKRHSRADKNIFYIVRPTSSDHIDLLEEKYYFNDKKREHHYTVEKTIRFSVSQSDLTSFSESNGYFYSDTPYEELNGAFSDQGLSLNETEDIYANDLSRFLYENSFPILVVAFFTLIISLVLTLKDVKEVAIMSLQGISRIQVKMRLTFRMFKGLISTVCVVFTIFLGYKFLQNKYLSLIFFKFYFIVMVTILAIYTLVYYLALGVTNSVDIVSVLKNKDYSKPAYISLLVIQSIAIIMVPILFSSYWNNYQKVKSTKREIGRLYELENYYTYYGVNANYYDSLANDDLTKLNENFQRFYNDHRGKGYYFEPDFTQYCEQYGASIYKMPTKNIVYMDEKYYNDIARFSKKPYLKVQNNTLMIPEGFKEKTDEIINDLNCTDKNLEIIYIEDNLECYFDDYVSGYDLSKDEKSLTKNGINNVIAIIDPNNIENNNPYANTVFIDKMTNGFLFFKEQSLQNMMKLTKAYHINKLVTPESKIGPYKEMLYNLEYTYKILTYTLALTLISIVVINTFVAEIIINNKKRLIAVGFLYGKNIMYSLKNNFIIFVIVSLISACIMFAMQKLTMQTFIIIIGLNLYNDFYLALKYWNLVNKKTSILLKGEQ